ncbi:MAG: hypothetical protein QF681_19130, partial [Vicinamibacterales bacterium]|nr:hypothetical protein [Vicinamibacterales bacterium]
GYGWQGPYIRSFASNTDWTSDAWGQPFEWATSGSTAGQIISKGADGTLSTADDISYPLSPPPTTGPLAVNVVTNGVANAFGVAAKLYYPVDGVQTGTAMQSFDPAGDPFDGFSFTGIPAGVRAAILNHTDAGCPGCGTDVRVVSLEVVAGQTNILEVRIETSCQVGVVGSLSCPIPDITP